MTDETVKPKRKVGRPKREESLQSLTPRQVLFVKELLKGRTQAQAGRVCGFTEKDIAHKSWQFLQGIKRKAPDIMNSFGLTQEALIERHLTPMLDATEVKVFKTKGTEIVTDEETGERRVIEGEEIIYSKPLVAWETRRGALDMAFKLHGSYSSPDAEAQVQVLNKITVVIEDVSKEGMVDGGKVIEQAN